jgi:hypothetical protein
MLVVATLSNSSRQEQIPTVTDVKPVDQEIILSSNYLCESKNSIPRNSIYSHRIPFDTIRVQLF